MHPAYSVIFFTTASGAGYGLLALLAVSSGMGWVPPDRLLGLIGMGTALALITAGLLSSTAHLGHPERAWRALSQWRSSWLSREGVLAIATYIPAGIVGIGWGMLGRTTGLFAFCAFLSAALACFTVFATGMIYQSLPTIRQWHQPLTAPIYLTVSAATGALLFCGVLGVAGLNTRAADIWALLCLAAALALKLNYWHLIDASKPLADGGSATGLGRFGSVRQLESPHTQANFVMREMGFSIARKHARKLRQLVIALLFLLPALLCLSAIVIGGGIGTACLIAAIASAALGVVTERWLFFAEAEHVVMAFYS